MNVPIGSTHEPLTKLITAALRERILNGEIALGERLIEGRLSEELGVSRMPVREALRELAAEGIVTIEPRRGATVTTYSEQQKRELVEVRATLEALNAKLAARRHDPEQIRELEAILEDGAELMADDNPAAVVRQNFRFHEALGKVAGNSVLQDMIGSLRDRTAMLFAPDGAERARQNWQEHEAILRAVVAGDGELAALLAARHVYNAAQMPQQET